MIAILADDLTGAAELAGLAAARGLSAEVQTARPTCALDEPLISDTDAQVLAIDVGTRSQTPAAAAKQMTAVFHQVLRLQPDWWYAKFDSVLRGPIAPQLAALRQASGLSRALLSPANPSRGRIVADGCYFLDGTPLDRTCFRHDPGHPVLKAEVLGILGPGWGSAPRDRPLPAVTGAYVADAVDTADSAHWASQAAPDVLVAGAADFFAALLALRVSPRPAQLQSLRRAGPSLIVCGSLTGVACGRANELREAGWNTETLSPGNLESQLDPICTLLESDRALLLTLDAGSQSSQHVLPRLAELVTRVIAAVPLARLGLEGGDTARAVLDACGWRQFSVVDAPAPGVVGLVPAEGSLPVVYLKPGSYRWPASMLEATEQALGVAVSPRRTSSRPSL